MGKRGVLLAACALVTAGCGQTGPPELTVYADGSAITVAPVAYCDVTASECETDTAAAATLAIRPGRPAQVSVPGEVAETPWWVVVQTVGADGNPLPPVREFFAQGTRHAYTAQPGPGERLLVVEVQQAAGVLTSPAEGAEPAVPARGLWSVQFTEG